MRKRACPVRAALALAVAFGRQAPPPQKRPRVDHQAPLLSTAQPPLAHETLKKRGGRAAAQVDAKRRRSRKGASTLDSGSVWLHLSSLLSRPNLLPHKRNGASRARLFLRRTGRLAAKSNSSLLSKRRRRAYPTNPAQLARVGSSVVLETEQERAPKWGS